MKCRGGELASTICLNALTGILCFSTTSTLNGSTKRPFQSQCPDGHSLFFHKAIGSEWQKGNYRLNALTGILCFSTGVPLMFIAYVILGSTAKVAILLSPDQRVAYPGCSLAIEAHRQVCYACVCDQIADCGPRRAKWQIASFALLRF